MAEEDEDLPVHLRALQGNLRRSISNGNRELKNYVLKSFVIAFSMFLVVFAAPYASHSHIYLQNQELLGAKLDILIDKVDILNDTSNRVEVKTDVVDGKVDILNDTSNRVEVKSDRIDGKVGSLSVSTVKWTRQECPNYVMQDTLAAISVAVKERTINDKVVNAINGSALELLYGDKVFQANRREHLGYVKVTHDVLYHKRMVNFYEAEDLCHSVGAHLLVTNSEEEHDEIMRFVEHKLGMGATHMWLGLNRKKDKRTWKTSNDEIPVYLHDKFGGSLGRNYDHDCMCTWHSTSSVNSYHCEDSKMAFLCRINSEVE